MENKALLLQIKAFRSKSEPPMAEYKFGMESVGDPNLVNDLKMGRELRSGTMKRLLAYLKTGRRELRRA